MKADVRDNGEGQSQGSAGGLFTVSADSITLPCGIVAKVKLPPHPGFLATDVNTRCVNIIKSSVKIHLNP